MGSRFVFFPRGGGGGKGRGKPRLTKTTPKEVDHGILCVAVDAWPPHAQESAAKSATSKRNGRKARSRLR